MDAPERIRRFDRFARAPWGRTKSAKSSLRENLLINALKHGLRWLKECPDGRFQRRYQDSLYRDAYDLLLLGRRYDTIETIFIYASRGLRKITLDGIRVVPVPLVDAEDARYYAYNRLVSAGIEPPPPSLEGRQMLAAIADCLAVTDQGFRVKFNPKMVTETMKAYRPVVEPRFQLPGDWRTTQYSFGDLKRFYSALSALAAIQFHARLAAKARGAPHLGFNDSVLAFGRRELKARICRYSQLGDTAVIAILEDLTYGSRGVDRPDPALQPIIPVSVDALLVSPSLILCLSPERNHCTLLNSIAVERQLYAGLVNQKENLMRQQILNAANANWRRFSGEIPQRRDLPDIDLALIDDQRDCVLILELKWFIDPDEVREVLNKHEELKKGVNQLKRLLAAFEDGSRTVQRALNVPDTCRCQVAVVSQNWIGFRAVQDQAVPIISLRHLEGALRQAESLLSVALWLNARKYLPTDGVHFRVVSGDVTIGDHSALWYDIEPLISGTYDPLVSLPEATER